MNENDLLSSCRCALEAGDLPAARSALERVRGEVYRLEGIITAREHGRVNWREAENKPTREENEALR